MQLRFMRPGGRTSLVVALFLGVPFCEVVSWSLWLRNPLAALIVALFAGAVVWFAFLRPIEAALCASPHEGDPMFAVFASTLAAWGARLALTATLLTGLHLGIETADLFFGAWLDIILGATRMQHAV